MEKHSVSGYEELYKAYSQFQQNLDNPKKDTEAYNYKYATLDSVITNIKEAMAGTGLSFAQDVNMEDGYISITTYIFHESGQSISFGPIKLPQDSTQGKTKVQATGSSITYARRYALSAVAGMASEEDDDAQITKNNYSAKNRPNNKPKNKTKNKTKKKQKKPLSKRDHRLKEIQKLYKEKNYQPDDNTNKMISKEIGSLTDGGKLEDLDDDQFDMVLALIEQHIEADRASADEV